MKHLLAIIFLLLTKPVLAENINYHFIYTGAVGSAQALTFETYLECFRRQGVTVTKEHLPGGQGKIAFDKLSVKTDNEKTLNLLLGNVGVLTLSNYTSIEFLQQFRTLGYASRTDLGIIAAKNSNVTSLTDVKTLSNQKKILIGVVVPSLEYMVKVLEKDLNLNIEFVRYKKVSDAYIDLMQGSIDLVADTIPSAMGLVEAEKLKFIATNIKLGDDVRKNPLIQKSDVISLDGKVPNFGTIVVSKNTSPEKITFKFLEQLENCNKDSDVKKSLLKYHSYIVQVPEQQVKKDLETFIKSIK